MNTNVWISLSVIVALFVTPATISNSTLAQSEDDSTMGLGSGALLKKTLNASSLSNIQAISLVNGIEVSGITLGDDAISVTLKQSPSENNTSKISTTPVTVRVLRVPASSIKDLLTLMEASSRLKGGNNTTPIMGMVEKMGGLLEGLSSNTTDPTTPLQALAQLGRTTEIGFGSIVGGDWKKPRTVTLGLLTLGEMLGTEGNPSANARAHFITVFVVPYIGKTNFDTVESH